MPQSIDEALADVTTRLKWHAAQCQPIRSRFEGCAILRANIDRMWEIVHLDVDTFLDESDKEPGFLNDVVADLAKEIAAVACRMLIEVDLSEPGLQQQRS
jgi:hypothetical protein